MGTHIRTRGRPAVVTNDRVAIPSVRARCYLVYALAPEGMRAAEANRAINSMIGDDRLPLALWHDHFLGEPGGCVVFYVASKDQQVALFENQHLVGWRVHYRPMVFSFSPAAFDAQISYTLQTYGQSDWDELRQVGRPDYDGRNVQAEAETAQES